MTWSETTRRWRLMREIEDLLVADPAARLPWDEEYADLFGDQAHLVTALRYRWQNARDAQLDTHAPEPAWDEQVIRLERRTRTLLRLLDEAVAREQGEDRAVA
jgi:hypothetical protein